MIALAIVLAILLLLTAIALGVCVAKFVKLAKVIFKMETALENTLDVIDVAYRNVGKILQLPLASNDVKVMRIHSELKEVHETLLRVANQLVSSWDGDDGKRESGQR